MIKWVSEWMRVSKWIVLFEKNKRTIVFLHFCLSKEPPKHRSCSTRCKSQTSCYFKQVTRYGWFIFIVQSKSRFYLERLGGGLLFSSSVILTRRSNYWFEKKMTKKAVFYNFVKKCCSSALITKEQKIVPDLFRSKLRENNFHLKKFQRATNN